MLRRKGFTLIELLVVIGIIALLMSILMPALQRARIQAKLIICKMNIKQMGNAVSTAAADRNGLMPEGLCGVVEPDMQKAWNHHWMDQLRPYFRTTEMLVCPMASKPRHNELTAIPYQETMGKTFLAWGRSFHFQGYDGKKGDYGSYGFNGYVFNPQPGSLGESVHGNGCWRGVQMKSAYRIPAYGDAIWMDIYPGDSDIPQEIEDVFNENQAMQMFFINRHECGIHMLFLDMSVRKVYLKELWTLPWSRLFDITAGPPCTEWPQWVSKCSKCFTNP